MFIQRRWIRISCQLYKESNIKLKGKSKSSQEWLTRYFNDPYVEKAKICNYRSRSAFKLLEIDEKYSFLRPGHCVLDCGAAPGSWTQVAISKTNADRKDVSKPFGEVFSVDRSPLYPLQGAQMIGRVDLSKEDGIEKVKEVLNGRKVDVFLSDAAPNAIGVKDVDHDAIMQLAYALVRFALGISKVGACLLIKIWDGKSSNQLVSDINKFYRNVKSVKPRSSRADSTEFYIFARDFKGICEHKTP